MNNMQELISNLLLNVLANLVFWLGLGALVRLTIRKTRTEFLKFFNLETNRKFTVYLSNLWLPSMKREPWGCIVSGQEFRTTETVNSLFGSTPFNFPEVVKGLVDAFWIGKSIKVGFEISPLTESFDLANNLIVVGVSTKNSVRKYLINKNMVSITIDGEPTSLQTTDDDILVNPLKQRFIVMKGKLRGEPIQREGNYNLAVIEKIYTDANQSVVFMCAGLRGDGSWAATEYLARHWRELYKKFEGKEFSRCLWFPYIDRPMDDYREPIHFQDLHS